MRLARLHGPALVLVVAVTVAASSCSNEPRPSAPLPPSPTMLFVDMDEYGFRHPPQAAAGRVVFRLANLGDIDHELTIVPLPENLPGTLNEQLHSNRRRALPTLRFVPPLKPGERGAFAMDLRAGRYGFLCSIVADDGETHALKGMNSELRVLARTSVSSVPGTSVPRGDSS